MARALAPVYRQFGEAAAGTSPLYGRVATAISESSAALAALDPAPPRKRSPAVILAALHDLALAGRAPDLAAAYASADGPAAAAAALSTLTTMSDAVAAVAVRRPVRPGQTGRHTVLYPAITEAARRLGATALGLIDVSCGAGLSLSVDRVFIRYEDAQPPLGDPESPVRQTASVVGGRPVPALPMPQVVARLGIDADPADVTDPDEARWLRACLPPDQKEAAARLDAELALAAQDPPRLLRGDPVSLLPGAIAQIPAGALPVITTTWALSAFPPEARLRFLNVLGEAGAARPAAWVSVEGVGVAPAIQTMGDRRASGHSIIGLATFDHRTLRTEALGRCWSRGRLLSWLATT
jgi:hypothetical protein